MSLYQHQAPWPVPCINTKIELVILMVLEETFHFHEDTPACLDFGDDDHVEWSFFLLYCHESKNYAWCHCWWIVFGKFHAKLFLLLNCFFFHCWHVFHPITSSLVICWILECAPSPALYFYFSTSQLSHADPSNSLPFLAVWCCCFLPWFQMSIAYSWRLQFETQILCYAGARNASQFHRVTLSISSIYPIFLTYKPWHSWVSFVCCSHHLMRLWNSEDSHMAHLFEWIWGSIWAKLWSATSYYPNSEIGERVLNPCDFQQRNISQFKWKILNYTQQISNFQTN